MDQRRSERRVFWSWAAVLAALAAGLCFVPLFDLLGFEFSLTLGLAIGPAAAHLGSRTRALSRGVRRALGLLLAPLLLITLNGLRVRNCNYFEGLRLFLLLPVVGAVIGVAWGRAAALIWARPGRALATVLALGLGSIGWALYTFVATPQIAMHGAAYGWWPGALYDEALGVPETLGWSRLADLAGAWLALAVAQQLAAWRTRRWQPVLLVPLGASLALAAGLFSQRVALGYHQDRASLEAALSVVERTPRLTLHLPPGRFDAAARRRLVEDLSYRLDRLEALFGLPADTRRPLQVYVHGSRAQRRWLVGADRVSIAKPWLAEVQLVAPAYGDPVVAHELAHIVAGRFAPGWLAMPTRWGVLPQMGLVEGAAVAAEWDEGPLTPHGWSAAMRRLKIAPDPAEILSPTGFYTRAAARAYTVAGSFARFLIDEYGPARFRQAYASGDLAGAYPLPPAALYARWARFIDGLPLTDAELEHARLRFSQPSIFSRVCAREVARRTQEVQRLAASGRWDEAWAEGEQVCRFEPDNPTHLLSLFEIEADARQLDEARWTGARLLDHPRSGALQRGRILERLGDLAWQQDDEPEAHRRYLEAAGLPLGPEARRSVGIKLWAQQQAPQLAARLRDYLLATGPTREGALALLALELGRQARAEPVVAYLVGRALAQRELYHDAEPLLAAVARPGILAGDGPTALALREVELEGLRLLGRAQYLGGRFEWAERTFVELERAAPSSGVRAEAQDWATRSRWAAARRME